MDGDERCFCQRQKSLNQMLKQACPEEMPKKVRHNTFRVQHNNGLFFLCFVIPNLIQDLGFWFREFGF